MQDFLKKLGNSAIAIMLIVVALLFLFKYLSADSVESQPGRMLIGALALLLAGVIALPSVSSRISAKASKILLLTGLVIAGFLFSQLWSGVDEEIVFQKNKEHFENLTVQRLKDIRTAQEQYLLAKGKYTNNFDTLLSFVSENSYAIPYQTGNFHDSLKNAFSFEELMAQGRILRKRQIEHYADSLGMTKDEFLTAVDEKEIAYMIVDTTYSSVYAEFFSEAERAKKRLPALSVDSLPFSPYSGERFIMETSVTDAGGVKQSTILVKDPKPFGRPNVKKDTLQFGSLTEAITDGNWRK